MVTKILMLTILFFYGLFLSCKTQDATNSTNEIGIQAFKNQQVLQARQSPPKDTIFGIPAAMEMPDWAKEIGIIFPDGLDYIPEMSRITSVVNQNEGFNSIHFVFKGDYDKSLTQAEKIAKKAGIGLSPDFAEAKKIRIQNIEEARKGGQEIDIPEIKGAIYANHSPNPEDLNKLEYMISILVEENGLLTISVINRKQMEKASGGNFLK